MKTHLYLLGALLSAPTLLLAQETTGQIQGRLQLSTGDPVIAAQVSATSPDLLGTRRATSAGDGVFTLLALPPGTYTLRITAIGYRPLVIQDVRVQLGRVTGLGELGLEQAAVALSQITVIAPKVTIDPVRTTIGATLEAEELASLPGERDYKSGITILPHINSSYNGDPANSAGSTGLENMYFIDGVNVTTPFRATGGTSLPYNFVRSVEVRAGGYEAQYGRALGAIVNAVTYTGTNQFEANVFAFGAHSALSAAAKAQPTLRETGSYSYDIGARVSGPLVRDRLWFSVAYNPRVSHADHKVLGLGTYPDNSRADIFAGKVTWRALPDATLELSVFGDPTTHHEVDANLPELVQLTPLSADPYLHRIETGGTNVSLRGTAALGASLLLEASVSRANGRENFDGETVLGRTEAPFQDNVAGTISGGVEWPSYVAEHTTTAGIKGTLTAARHRVVMGGELEATGITRSLASGHGQGTVFRNASDYQVHVEGYSGSSFRNETPAVYVQDAWRVSDRWTLNAGIRWSRQRMVGPSGNTDQNLAAEWQPRAGFSWQLGPSGTARIFGSYGRFYQQEPLNLATLYYTDNSFRTWFYHQDPRQPGVVAYHSVDYTAAESDLANAVGAISAERYDEFTLGYERLLGTGTRLTIRGIHRHLGTTWQQGIDPTRAPPFVLGTPCIGDLSFLPCARRDYTALEVSLEGTRRRLEYRASYVLSRTWGNFAGLYGSDFYYPNPGVDFGLQLAEQARNSTGYLPNDRRHVLKLSGAWRISDAASAGAILTAQSGTPLNDFGVAGSFPCTCFPTFLVQRGSAGRTPAIVDLGFRFSYSAATLGHARTRLVLDLLHVGNPRTSVRVDQQQWFDAAKTMPNPSYRRQTAFQPPMSARLGLDMGF